MMGHDAPSDLAESLAFAGHSLREQELVARKLAATLARLSAETENISLKINSKTDARCCQSQCHLESIEMHAPCLVEPHQPMMQPAVVRLGTRGNGTNDASPAVTAMNDHTAWAQPTSSVLDCTKVESLKSDSSTSALGSLGLQTRTSRLVQACARAVSRAEPRTRARVFADPEHFRERIRLNLLEKPYKPEDLYKERGCAQRIVRHNCFEAASTLLVMFSSIWIAIDIDLNNSLMLHEAKPIFQVVAHVTCMLFFLELVLRCLAFKHVVHAFKDRWCLFDMVLVLILVFDVWVFSTVTAISGMTITGSSLKLMILFRVLRLCRVFRLARVLRCVPELMVIVRGIGIASRAILIVLLLLSGIIYVGAIIFRCLLEGTELGAKRFPSVLSAMGTLMLDCTLSGARGTPLMREAYKDNFIYAVLVLCFVLLANVTMMGVLAGLLVQTVKTVAESEKEENSVADLIDAMDALWRVAQEHNNDMTGTISELEFRSIMSVKQTAKLLKNMDIDVLALAGMSEFVFEQHGGKLCRKDFLKMVLDFRGGLKSTVKDHIETRKFFHRDLQRALRNSFGNER